MTKYWAQHNYNILGLGNDMARVGAQGGIDAAKLGAEMNPYGLAAGALANVGQTAQDPNSAYAWWEAQNVPQQFLQGGYGGYRTQA